MNLASHFKAAISVEDATVDLIAQTNDFGIEAASASTQVAAYELEEANRIQSELEDVAESLESYREALVLSQEAGSIDQASAAWMLSAGDAIVGRIGVTLNSVSVESFASPSDAADAVELVSLEAEGVLGKIGEAIKAMIQNAMAALKKFWITIYDGSSRLAKAGDALAKKAKDTKGAAATTELEISNGTKMHIAGKAPSSSDILGSLDTMKKLADDILKAGDAEKVAKSYIDALSEIGSNLDKGEFIKVGALVSAMAGLGFSSVGTSSSDAAILSGATGTAKISDEMLGGKVVFAITPAKDATAADAATGLKFGVTAKDSKASVADKLMVGVMSISEVEKVGSMVADVAKTMDSYKKAFEGRNKIKEDIVKAIGDLEKKLDKAENLDAAKKTHVTSAVKLARGVVGSLDNPAQPLAAYLMSTLGAVVALGNASLKEYKE